MKRLALTCAVISILVAGSVRADRLPRTVVPERYKLIVTPQLMTSSFLGDEVITVRVNEPVREITLHAADLDIGRVHVKDSERRQRAQVELDPESMTMTIRFRRELVPGPAEIRISYRGGIRDDLRGLYVSRTAKDEYLFTQFEPIDARRFFPCFDEPGLKARFDLTVIVDSGDVAISNTKVISSLPGPSRGSRRIRFATTPPMSTYMLALAVGPFDCLSGRQGRVPVRFCAQNAQEWRGRSTFEGSMELLAFYQDWFGLPYPFDKLDIVALPDMAAGGMENPGAIFLRENWALVDRDAGMDAKRWSSALLAHEMAHMWVGDLVTSDWWSDIWLNEGLASWVSAKALESWRPEVGVEEIQTFRRIKTFDDDSYGGRRPVSAPIDNDRSLFELFNLVNSEKPATMMSMLEGLVGEDAVRRSIRDYLITYSWGNASTTDFVSHIEQSLGEESANVVSDFVSRPSFPVIEVASKCEGRDAHVTFSERAGAGAPWHVPVCYRTLQAQPIEKCTLVAGRADAVIPGGCDVPLLVNPGAPGYYRVIYSDASLSKIVDATSTLSVPERLNLLDNEWFLVVEGHETVGEFLALIERGFSAERHPEVVGMIVNRLGYIDRNYTEAEKRGDYRAWLRSYFGTQLQRIGFTPAAGETSATGALRRELMWGAGALGGDPAVIDYARRYVREFLDDPSTVDKGMADAMVRLAARYGDEALYNVYLSRARRSRGNQDGYRFLMGLTSFTDPDLVRRTVELTMTDVVRSQDATAVLARLLVNPDSSEAAWDVVRERWGELKRHLPVTFTSERVVYGAGSFCSRERRDEVAAFFSGIAAPPATLESSLARIDRCVANRGRQTMALSSWISDEARLASTKSRP